MSFESPVSINASPAFSASSEYLAAVAKANKAGAELLQFVRDEATYSGSDMKVDSDFIDALNGYHAFLRLNDAPGIAGMKNRLYFHAGRNGLEAASAWDLGRNIDTYTEAILELIAVEKRTPRQ